MSKKFRGSLVSLLLVAALVLSACSSKDTSTSTTDDVATTDQEVTTETTVEETTPEATDVGGTLPRESTLYFGGLQWGAINGWNALSDDMNNAMALDQGSGGARVSMFETLYMYNMLDGTMVPLLADGDYTWNADMTEITVKIKDEAKWNDGTKVTANDVAYTFEASVTYGNSQGNSLKPYIDSVTALDDSTVLIKAALTEDGKPKNPLVVTSYLGQTYVLQKAWIQAVEERNGKDAAAIKKDKGEDIAFSGPYGPYYADDQKVVLVRNDSYWGQDASMWGELPEPMYLAHTIFADNAATEVAFKSGEIDVDQQFIPNIQDLWLKDGLPISTYMEDAPYGICVNMPTAWYNLTVPGLDNADVRKAIAMAVDYDAIIANAMTNQSPSFADVPRSLMNPTAGEQASYDHDAVSDLQWAGNDIAGANALLDAAGVVDTNGDGIRDINGVNLEYNACCPNGWTDWMAAMEMVAAAGEEIGISITTEFPEWSVYSTVVTAASQDQYDIFMMWTDSAAPTQPWGRVRQLLSSEYNGIEGNWSGNWGHYANDRADEIIQAIPTETDEAALKALYTEAVEIYLTDVPSFSLMYRPDKFHAVNETIWTNYPESSDGKNIPPLNLVSGYGIAGLYEIELIN
jgi:peptide/nickel transport system substrate-binding protein